MLVSTVSVLESSPVLVAGEGVHIVLDVSVLDVSVLGMSVLLLVELDVFVLVVVVLAVFVLGALLAQNYALLVTDYPPVSEPAVLVVEVHVGSEAVLANVNLTIGYWVVSERRGDLRHLVQVCFEHATLNQLHDLAW